ncbi:hypothetical protein [Halogeometricum limi]|uniref:Uncharacterized protein n=1 Tax=Halogeometricum limi TaxID=555875 RepID=A0A1I6G4N8_9EURY|nr:hypothetical protein [Halogeometricum limi]SFR37101.1 hypothetical protein SAMN04488124_0858 [Halogeometricum limi]
MTETDVDLVDTVVEAAADRGDNLVVRELAILAMRHDPFPQESDTYGISRTRLVAYAAALPDGERRIDADDVERAFAEQTTGSESWVDADHLYVTGDDHVSPYPRAWHETLEGEDDLIRFVEVILAEVGDSESAFDRGGHDVGVPERILLNAATALGPLTRTETKEQLERHREEGTLAERADQHPDASVRLAGVDHD